MGASVVNTSVASPPVSVLGAPPAAPPVLQPTAPGLGLIPGASLPVIIQSIETAPPTECLLLKNMFDPTVETDPDFDLDIRDDVQEECSKFGQVRHIFVDKESEELADMEAMLVGKSYARLNFYCTTVAVMGGKTLALQISEKMVGIFV